MTDKTYNGWANYATWRVNLEIFDGIDPCDMGWMEYDKYDLAVILMEYADEIVTMDCKDGLALGYAQAFMSDVNYREIAAMMLSEYADETETEAA